MFNITHTTPQRVLGHLHRLKREGDALVARDDVTLLEESQWAWRVDRYLRRILEDRWMLDRLRANELPALDADDFASPPQPPPSREERRAMIGARVNALLTTLTSIIDQLEGDIESSSC